MNTTFWPRSARTRPLLVALALAGTLSAAPTRAAITEYSLTGKLAALPGGSPGLLAEAAALGLDGASAQIRLSLDTAAMATVRADGSSVWRGGMVDSSLTAAGQAFAGLGCLDTSDNVFDCSVEAADNLAAFGSATLRADRYRFKSQVFGFTPQTLGDGFFGYLFFELALSEFSTMPVLPGLLSGESIDPGLPALLASLAPDSSAFTVNLFAMRPSDDTVLRVAWRLADLRLGSAAAAVPLPSSLALALAALGLLTATSRWRASGAHAVGAV